MLTLPGEFAGIAEEIAPDKNTFEENGNIYSSVIGLPVINKAKRSVSVQAFNKVKPLSPGDIIVGFVSEIYDQIAQVRIISVEGRERTAVHNVVAFIRISEIIKSYVENFRDHLRTGDYLRAEVIEITDLGTYLSISKPELGVVKAFCSRCRGETEKKESVFLCRECGFRERRKAAITD
ncbi:exosome complex RNA-binding protein Csl4 [Candidatus Micrarchaeota archaeon]|nr:exosome complex RNA-binding protein Csl4 [Candidatus Micrarchaeota archaeon]